MITRRITVLAALSCALAPARIACASAGEDHEAYSFLGDLPFWGIIAFVLFVIAVYKLGWNALITGMNNREAEENRLIGEAEQARREAEALLRDHRGRLEAVGETIQELITEAHRDAEITRQDIIATARREAETLKNRALHEIARVRDQSLDEIFVKLNERVIAETESRLATGMSADDQNRLIEETLVRFESTT